MNAIQQVKIKGKMVLLRTDFNVPMENGQITSERLE